MTKLQRAYSIFFSLCLAGTLLFLPGQFFFSGNVYMRLPLYSFLENRAGGIPKIRDTDTSDLIMEANRRNAGSQMEGEQTGRHQRAEPDKDTEMDQEAETDRNTDTDQEVLPEALAPDPQAAVPASALANYDYLMNQFYIVDENTAANAELINAARFLSEDLSITKDSSRPQILIYHSHSQESFLDSRDGYPQDTVVGIGDYLTELLTEQYGYQVIHITDAFDLANGYLDRSKAYDAARATVEQVLAQNPSIEVVIDLHRDGVPENRHLVTEINGKETAQILFYNGLSYTQSEGKLAYLPNPYIQQNLAFSFQLEFLASQYFPDYPRGIYLAGLRYNLHLRPRALLLEAGAQTNTVQEVKNAMEPFAAILDQVLSGEKAKNTDLLVIRDK